MRLISRILRAWDRRRQSQQVWLNEYEFMLLASNQKMRDGRLHHSAYRDG